MLEVEVNPGALGFDAQRLKNIDGWMQRYIDEGKFAGSSVLIARHGKIAHLATVGKRSLAHDLPFTQDTIVRIYSMTKPIVSVALMRLVEKGLLHLDAPVSRFLPEFGDCRALIPGAISVSQSEAVATPTVHQNPEHRDLLPLPT